MFNNLLIPYGKELSYSQLLNIRGRIVYAVFGEKHPGHLNRFFVNHRYLGKYGKSSNINILEIGSANGAFAFWLSRKKEYTVVALDIEKNLILDCENIRKKLGRNNLSFILNDATTKFPQRNTFDIIFSSHVLEHITNDQEVLINAFYALKPGGVLILQVPYGESQKEPSNEGIKSGHVRDGYSEADLHRKLENAGFEIISVTGSIGRIGRFAYRFARQAAKIRIVFNLSTILFPVTLALIYLEQAAAFLRSREPDFKYGPLVVARRPLYE